LPLPESIARLIGRDLLTLRFSAAGLSAATSNSITVNASSSATILLSENFEDTNLGALRLYKRQGFREVIELDWGQDWSLDGLRVTCLPAVHFSGRGAFDRNRTLWASFAFAAPSRKLWFGGDTAPGAVFREIGARAGPFDLALVGIGAYEPRSIMHASHATPEEAVQIARDIGAKAAVGMHWGSIMLTPEDPFKAPHRFKRAALEQQYGEGNAWVMKVGEVRGF